MNTLLRLLASVSLSHMRTEKLKTALTVSGMAIGIAVYTAIRAASINVFDSFDFSTRQLSAGAPYSIVGRGSGVPEKWIPGLSALSGIKLILPQSERQVKVISNGKELGPARVIGMDLFRAGEAGYLEGQSAISFRGKITALLANPKAAVISGTLSQELNGGELILRAGTREIKLDPEIVLPEKGYLEAYGGKVVILDIAHYQSLFDDYGHVGRLNVFLEKDADIQKLKSQIEGISSAGLSFVDGNTQSAQGKRMTEAFRLNLYFLASVSLLVAVLLIYNSMNYSVLKRRREIGILLALGALPRQLFLLICLESAAAGLAASVLGLASGSLLARIAVSLMSSTVTNLYFPVEVTRVVIKPLFAAEILALGPTLALAGSLIPCLEIFQVHPREAINYQDFEEKFRRWIPAMTAAGSVLLLASFLTAREDLLRIHIAMGFVPPALLVAGLSALVPVSLESFLRAGKKIFGLRLGIDLLLAFDHIRMTLQRNTAAVASAMIALGMFIGVTILILSFRGTVEDWIHYITKADLFISSQEGISAEAGNTLPEEMVRALAAHPDVRAYDWVSSARIMQNGREVRLAGVRYEILEDFDRLLYLKPFTREERRGLLARPGAALVSETYANRFRARIGGKLEIPGENGSREFEIANIFYDYSSDQGVIYIRDREFDLLFPARGRQGISLYLKSGAHPESIRQFLQEKYPEALLNVRDNQSLRRYVLDVFDQTFRITYVLQVIAMLIAAFSILNTVLMLSLERSREFGVLRAIGADTASLVRMITSEALILGTASAAGAYAVGFGLAWILVFVVNKFFFGWSVHFDAPCGLLVITGAGAVALAGLAGFIPGIFIARRVDAEMIRYE